MATVDKNNVTLTHEELANIIAQAEARIAATENAEENNPAPTLVGKHYHSFCAERNSRAASKWEAAAAASPLGGGFCRIMSGLARIREQHHRNGGFFGGW